MSKVVLGMLFLVLSSSVVCGDSLLAETKLICSNADKSVALQEAKIKSASQSMDGYMKMLAIRSFKGVCYAE